MFKPLLTAAAAVLVLAIVPVQAQVASSRTVTYADLDLSTADGQQTLEKRLRAAIRAVCGPLGMVDVATSIRGQKCKREAAAKAASEAQLAITRDRTRLALRGL